MMRILLFAILLFLSGVAWAGPQEDAVAAYNRGDYATAIKITRPLAANGEAWAQFFLAVSYTNGQGVPKNEAESVKWYRLAAAQGFAPAQGGLAISYEYGLGVAKDKTTALNYYKLAAEQGWMDAQLALGWKYETGDIGVLQDYVEALKWFRLAAAQGSQAAQLSLGVFYGAGQGVPRNPVLAHMWSNIAATSSNTVIQEKAAKNREISAKQMTPQQVAQAQEMARECQQRNFKGCD